MVDQLSRLHRTGAPPEPPHVTAETQDPFTDFWDKYNQIQSKITDINYTLDQIVKLDEELEGCCDQSRSGDIRTEINNKLSSIGASGNQIKTDLEKLKQEVESSGDLNPGSADIRLQKNHLHLLTNNFAETIQHFSAVQSDIKAKFSQQVIRHYNIAGVPLDEDKVNQIIDNNPEALETNIFTLAGGAQAQQVAQVYNRIASRHHDILEIETRLNELLELFVQFSIIVHEQGRQVDCIEQNIATARDYVKKGTEQLEIARKDQKKSRKWLWIIVIIGVILLVAVILIAIFAS
ncbi:syntaxin-2 isoform X1 [Histomonas meleagridis]|uniref:syntaxin-2 isoform X1 n=1 Tax=Histomonas meleagridis TaxID=135588 RepID=UPI003559D528|nr:syntaxin-2 isoform X1 [Histomonas meleagridis]KAH0796600.1 syntaxin-2 isoform X1 [Histomonas meleagridis]